MCVCESVIGIHLNIEQQTVFLFPMALPSNTQSLTAAVDCCCYSEHWLTQLKKSAVFRQCDSFKAFAVPTCADFVGKGNLARCAGRSFQQPKTRWGEGSSDHFCLLCNTTDHHVALFITTNHHYLSPPGWLSFTALSEADAHAGGAQMLLQRAGSPKASRMWAWLRMGAPNHGCFIWSKLLTIMIIVNYCQLLSIIVNYCQLLSIIYYYCQLLSIIYYYCQLLSIIVNYCQLLSIIVNYLLLLSIIVFWCFIIFQQWNLNILNSNASLYIWWSFYIALWSARWCIGWCTECTVTESSCLCRISEPWDVPSSILRMTLQP